MLYQVARFIFGPKVKADLPLRVKENIRQRQDEAEKLIGWVQLSLAVLMGVLWWVSPAPLSDVAFHPVPWAVGIYGLFTVIRLVLSYRMSLPSWFLTVSIIMDVTLLMILIWSFHIQYMQPPSFYLKAPTFWYAFVFIVLRALRFEPRFVLITGGLVIVGRILLMVYVVTSIPEDRMITRDFVEYMTSNSILIGAEIDKLITIFLVTGLLGVASERARRSFIQSVSESIAAADLSRFVSREFANRITSVDHELKPGDGEEKVVTVMFTDIEGFSTLSEHMEPSELARTLNDYFEALSSVIDQHNGVINMFQGDAMLVVFNGLRAEPDHATQALNCAQEIVRLCNSRTFGDGITLKTRCGINTGPVIIGVMGSADRMVFTVYGDNVNLAARLEQKNKEYGTYILASDQTRLLSAAGAYDFDLLGRVVVKGRTQETDVFTPRPAIGQSGS